MQYQFKQAVHITDKNGRFGKDYARGLHEVPEMHEYAPLFLKYVGLGLIVEPDFSTLIAAETSKQRAEKLHNKVVAAQKAKALKGQPSVSNPPVVDSAPTEENCKEEAKEEEKPAPEKKSKKK